MMNLYNYLLSKGYTPVRKRTNEVWFCSPLRNEKTASFKLDTNRNVWFDFGIFEGGGFKRLLELLGDKESLESFVSKKTSEPSPLPKKKDFKIVNTIPVAAPKLLEYLDERVIKKETALKYCKQVNYLHGKRSYYSIGFINEENGYELRNRIFKNCIGKKSFSHLENGSKRLAVFEGFFDFLSFIELFPTSQKMNFLILNSVGLYHKAKPVLMGYHFISLYLDNDAAGDRATEAILADFPKAVDCRGLYEGCKDLNEFLVNKSNKINF